MTDPTPPDVHAALSGDAAAFGRLLEQQHRALWAIALAILADPRAAEEAIQEAALAAWRSREQLQDPTRFVPWLRQLTRNRCRDRIRRQVRRPERADDQHVQRVGSDSPDPERLAESRQEAAILREALSGLDAGARELLLLFHAEGRSSREVARHLGMSDAAVRQRLVRARAALKDQVEARLHAVARRPRPAAGALLALLLAVSAREAQASASTAATGGSTPMIGAGIVGAGLVAAAAVVALLMVSGSPATGAVAAPATVDQRQVAKETALYELARAAGTDVVRCEVPEEMLASEVDQLAARLGFWVFTSDGAILQGAHPPDLGTEPPPVPRDVQLEIVAARAPVPAAPVAAPEVPTASAPYEVPAAPDPVASVRTVELQRTPLPQVDGPEPQADPEPEPELEDAAGTADDELELGTGELLIYTPNVYGQIWIDGTSYGPAPVVVKDLPAGVARIEVRVDKHVQRSVEARVVADAREKVVIP